MTDEDRVKVEFTLSVLEVYLKDRPNSCEFEFYLKLREELIRKLKETTCLN